MKPFPQPLALAAALSIGLGAYVASSSAQDADKGSWHVPPQFAGQDNASRGAAFLAENAGKPGVRTTASGLQYAIVKEGTGPRPRATDTVSVNYVGSLLDGTVFDSSERNGGPVSFGVGDVIPGWTEGLQLMPVGSKFTFWIPSGLAYGSKGTPGGPIGPNAMLKFEVELVSKTPP